MKIATIMNFVRNTDNRIPDAEKYQFNTTKAQLEMMNKYGVENTFLLQYDSFTSEKYINLFKNNMTEKTELGLWYEIVRPLTDSVGLEWRGDPDAEWDWHIVPGFSMAYTKEEREKLIDSAMNKFKEIYGFYPKTVASWLIDSYTVEYLEKNYEISAFAICRDQTNTDAYTLVGGYFNQAYYPSKYNMFTPAQTEEYQVNVPIFRLLGPDPIHNYDLLKYINKKYLPFKGCCTLEPSWRTGYDEEIVRWFFDSYYKNEDLGFSYAQLGQENSFGIENLEKGMILQLEILKEYPEVKFMKMRDAGELFKKMYKQTPATSVVAVTDWDGNDEVQSAYYDCKNYVANIFRYKNKIFLRCLYLFDERVAEDYYDTPCTTWDATYENLPIADTLLWEDNDGILIDSCAEAFIVSKIDEDVLSASWNDKKVVFAEDSIKIHNSELTFNTCGSKARIELVENKICYEYKGFQYALIIEAGYAISEKGVIRITASGGIITLKFRRNGEK